jgi:hypothetical protein
MNSDNAARVWPSGRKPGETWSIGCAAASPLRTESGTGAASAEVASEEDDEGPVADVHATSGNGQRASSGQLVAESRVRAYGERPSPIALTGFSRATSRCSS